VKQFVREDCGRTGAQQKTSGFCNMFPELYIEFDPGKPPTVSFHEENDDIIDLIPLQRDEIIQLFLNRGFVQKTSQTHEQDSNQEHNDVSNQMKTKMDSHANVDPTTTDQKNFRRVKPISLTTDEKDTPKTEL